MSAQFDTVQFDTVEFDTSRACLTGANLDLSYFGSQAVFDATLELLPGQVTVLVGPNGSGKSTLLRALASLHRPDSGTLVVEEGVDALALKPRDFAKKVTLLSQTRPTPTGLTVRDVVEFGRYPHRGRWRSEDPEGAEAIAWAMAVTGVTDMSHRGVDELSGGELQRVWVATSLAQRTDVLLLDEPTTFLDLRYQVEVLDLMRELADDHGVAVGAVLHDLNQASDVADRIALLSQGRIITCGSAADVFTEEYLSEIYGIGIDVDKDDRTGRIRTYPRGRHNQRR